MLDDRAPLSEPDVDDDGRDMPPGTRTLEATPWDVDANHAAGAS